MIGLDTNILARYYVEDEGDAESRRQRLLARDLIAVKLSREPHRKDARCLELPTLA